MLLIDYPYIRAYGKFLKWDDKKIKSLVDRAQKEEAPDDVVTISGNRWTHFKDYDALWQKRLTENKFIL